MRIDFYADTNERFTQHVKIAESLGIDIEEVESQAWEVLREFDYENLPSPSNTFIEAVYRQINQKVSLVYGDAITVSYYVNCLDSHLYMNDEEITRLSDFKAVISTINEGEGA